MTNGVGRVEHRDMSLWLIIISHLIGLFYAGVLLLNSPEKYHYLKQSHCYGDPSINDKEDFNNVMVCKLKKKLCFLVFSYKNNQFKQDYMYNLTKWWQF